VEVLGPTTHIKTANCAKKPRILTSVNGLLFIGIGGETECDSLMQYGCVIWLTGLPAAGKTTIARNLEKELSKRCLRVELLDGDDLRKSLSPELGFSRHDRELHAMRVTYVSRLLHRNGIIAIVALISPYSSIRQHARENIGKDFVEVWVKASVETCRRRDPKGIYKKADEGKLCHLTGVQDPYEPPLNPELILDTENEELNECTEKVMTLLRRSGYVGDVCYI